jgi:DNA-directed RNA polymerase specialized sigma24 family protein|tara:strand:+ start:567 stop:1268 length:702 start_codon:yes stop_codon:yes gene_type:complete
MPRKAKSKNYFTQDTEDAIVRYNNEPDSKVRSKIYEREIHYAFFKLTENIIHTFKFYYTEVDDIEHLQHEVITFLLSKIHLFDPSRGAKAYSYFGTIAKRYLILQNQKNYKKRIDKAPVDELFKDDTHSYNLDDPDPANLPINQFLSLYVEYCTENLEKLFPKKHDAQVADAILELFRKREDIDIFNKKALYIYIREMVDVKTPKITKIANQLYGIFKDNYIFFLDNGYVEFE